MPDKIGRSRVEGIAGSLPACKLVAARRFDVEKDAKRKEMYSKMSVEERRGAITKRERLVTEGEAILVFWGEVLCGAIRLMYARMRAQTRAVWSLVVHAAYTLSAPRLLA